MSDSMILTHLQVFKLNFFNHYCLFILLSTKKSDSVPYEIIDRSSLSSKCDEGSVLSSVDRIVLEVHLYLAGYTIGRDDQFVMERVEANGRMKAMCMFTYDKDCPYTSANECTCEEKENQTYYVYYSSLARVYFNDNILYINGQRQDDFQFPLIVGEPRYSVWINMKKLLIANDCQVKLKSGSTVLYQMCTQLINKAEVSVSYKNWTEGRVSLDKRLSRRCTSAAFCILDSPSPDVFITYVDMCHRSYLLTCSHQVFPSDNPVMPTERFSSVEDQPSSSTPGTTTTSRVTTPQHRPMEEQNLHYWFIVAALILVTMAVFALIICIGIIPGHCRNVFDRLCYVCGSFISSAQRRPITADLKKEIGGVGVFKEKESQSSLDDGFRSSPVDAVTEPSLTSLRRLTQRLSLKSIHSLPSVGKSGKTQGVFEISEQGTEV